MRVTLATVTLVRCSNIGDMNELHVVLGTGPAGTTLASTLRSRGHAVRTVSRSARPADPDHVAADLTDAAGAREALAGATVVHHAANVPYEQQLNVMPRMQTAILDAAADAGARVVVLDTLYPYGPTGGTPMTESTPWRATAAKGRMRAALDERYLAEDRVGVVMARAADFYGPGVVNATLGGAVFPSLLSGQPAMALGDPSLPHSYTYIEDVAAGLALLGETPDADGRVWHLPTAPAVPTTAVHTLIEELSGRELRVDVVAEPRPWGPFDAAFMAEYEELFYQYLEPQIMDSSAFEQRFGVAATPLREGLARTIAWFDASSKEL
jgi:nucleoside-diphosphate-sugar epimerase